eukprot:CAMPEP_0206622940 /NCGR_PEP_ID=MMETSP0325_2-20121206/63105_1 /ASSEMBLY_ACC=CAM_ASM_000347 /TAXON_ID=2866 /ORGANISM="Crypthecodinium cohnii, Strain Seligo" /LENGTH=188 /DNA_ID=CAMNT_0054146361 /DNA_START=280 /DNA_END=846 /DNA_ORIENTATION=+
MASMEGVDNLSRSPSEASQAVLRAQALTAAATATSVLAAWLFATPSVTFEKHHSSKSCKDWVQCPPKPREATASPAIATLEKPLLRPSSQTARDNSHCPPPPRLAAAANIEKAISSSSSPFPSNSVAKLKANSHCLALRQAFNVAVAVLSKTSCLASASRKSESARCQSCPRPKEAMSIALLEEASDS